MLYFVYNSLLSLKKNNNNKSLPNSVLLLNITVELSMIFKYFPRYKLNLLF